MIKPSAKGNAKVEASGGEDPGGSISQPPLRELGAGANSVRMETSKFDLGAPPTRFDGLELPWSYGKNKITALVRSPDSLYVCWEITDEGIEGARQRLGAGGPFGWCNLRVYDTTGRDFDGVNANDYFDVRVERDDRDYFLSLHRPTASFHVEIGIKTHEGYFHPIARSGRADMPRNGPSPDRSLEWMTVTSGDAPPAARPYTSKYAGPQGTWQAEVIPAQAHAQVQGGSAPGSPPPTGARSFTWMHPAHTEVRWEGPWLFESWKTEWRLHWVGTKNGTAVLPIEKAQWIAGPFPTHLLNDDRVSITFVGDGETLLEEHMSGLQIFGPWEVHIHGFQTEPEKRVLGTWRVHWARVEPAKVERWWTAFERKQVDAWERTRVIGGASESRVIVEGGASEMWRAGASERWSVGGSEWLAMGGSETAWRGSSELLYGGASALLYGGASAQAWGGASEWRFGGASEWLYGGAGASEGRPFGSSNRSEASSVSRDAREARAPWVAANAETDGTSNKGAR